MNLTSKKLSFVLLSAAFVFAGCSKKPKRPSPDQTVVGQGVGGGENLNATDGGLGGAGLTDPTAAGLAAREGVIDDGQTIRGLLQPVFFEYDSSAIRAGERAKLQEAQRYLNENPQHRILFEGHCDWRGTADYNLGLGDRRAGSARQYLESLGVPSTRIETLSKGDLDAVENSSEDQMSKDRRVEIVVLKQ